MPAMNASLRVAFHLAVFPLLGIGRVSENVKKNLVLCRVELPERQPPTLDTILEARVVDELKYSRWAPSSTREETGAVPDWPDSDG